MPGIDEEEIKALREKADIVEVLSHYLQVQKSGRSYKAICPFHDDHNPSLQINPQRQIYKCFSCGAGGNVFTFVQNYEHVSFPEAVARVAELTGFPLTFNVTDYQAAKDPTQEALYRVLDETIRFCEYQLDLPEAARYKQYLAKRGIDEEVRRHFQIGYNPGGDSLYRFLAAKKYSDRDMVKVNVTRIDESGPRDVFADRIMFPIHDRSGHPVGFSARTLDDQDQAKYINTSDNGLYRKGDIVYNSHRASSAARHMRCVYVTEGVMDVISFYRAGMENCVATLGTACTFDQIKVLKSLAIKVVFCYDGDDAGQSATYKAARMARQSGCEVAVVKNKTGLDPDEIIARGTPESLRQLVKDEMSYMEFVIDYLSGKTNFQNYSEKKKFFHAVQDEIRLLEDETDRRYFAKRLSDMTGFDVDITRAAPVSEPFYRPERKIHIPNGTIKAEDTILTLMINNPIAARRFEEELGYLISEDRQMLATMIIDQIHNNGKADLNELIDDADEQEMVNLITNLACDPLFTSAYDDKLMDGAMRKVKITSLTSEAEAYKEQLAGELNKESRDLIYEKYMSCLNECRRYIDEENS